MYPMPNVLSIIQNNNDKPEDLQSAVKPVIKIAIGPDRAYVKPYTMEFLQHFTVPKTRWTTGGRTGYIANDGVVLFGYLEGDGRVFPVGSVPEVEAILRRLGYPVEVTDYRKISEYAQPNEQIVASLSKPEQRFAEVIRRSPCGVIEVIGDGERCDYLACLVRMFRGRRIVIVSASKRQAKYLRRRLAARGVFTVCASASWLNVNQDRVISTPMVARASDRERADVVIFADALECTIRSSELVFSRSPDLAERCYGFIQRGERIGRREHLRICAVIGATIHNTTPASAVVEVRWAPPVPELVSFTRSRIVDPLDRKRRYIWENQLRNQFISAIAIALAIGNLPALWEHGLMLDDGADDWADGAPLLIAVLVENTEHAQYLHRYLAHWPIVFCRARDAPVPENTTAPANAIVTLTAATRIAGNYDVIVRADGGVGGLCVAGFPPLAQDSKRSRVLVIDIDDRFDKQARLATESRRNVHAFLRRRGSVSPIVFTSLAVSAPGSAPHARQMITNSIRSTRR